jgi:hypothetical protein
MNVIKPTIARTKTIQSRVKNSDLTPIPEHFAENRRGVIKLNNMKRSKPIVLKQSEIQPTPQDEVANLPDDLIKSMIMDEHYTLETESMEDEIT